MVFLGNPVYGVDLQPIDFVRFAEACGGIGFRCERPEEVPSALEAMMLVDGPALCEAVVDPFEPPMPAGGCPEVNRRPCSILLAYCIWERQEGLRIIV